MLSCFIVLMERLAVILLLRFAGFIFSLLSANVVYTSAAVSITVVAFCGHISVSASHKPMID